MINETLWRARTIVKRREVILCPDSSPPTFYHFKVKQRKDHGWADVWHTKSKGWSCGAVDPKRDKKGERWGCVINGITDKTRPYCSHTLACKIYMEQKGITNE